MPDQNIFIGWAGERSKIVAQALRSWLPCFSRQLKPWGSFELELGAHWNSALASRLQSTHVGIVCVTPGTWQTPWLNFEAGALSKSIDHSQVIPYMLDGRDFLGEPLSQFQGVLATKTETLRLVSRLLQLAGETAPPRYMFEAFWPPFAALVQANPEDLSCQQSALDAIELLYSARESLTVHELSSPVTAQPGETIQLEFEIECKAHDFKVWLGAHISRDKRFLFNESENVPIQLKHGRRIYRRTLTIPTDATCGEYALRGEVWFGPTSDTYNSFRLDSRGKDFAVRSALE